jgi:hypothetical protein
MNLSDKKSLRFGLLLLVATISGMQIANSSAANCVALPPGLISWWKGDGNALDQTGTNNGTLSGNVTFGTAEVGQGFFIDGTGPLVNITNTASLQVQDLSIELWIRRASSTVVSRDGNGNGHIFGFGPGGYTLYMDPSGHPSLGKTGVSAVSCTAAITDTNLHHVAVTKSGSTVVFYIDGTSLPAAAYNPGFTFSGPVYIGGVAGDANFYGTVDEVSVYNRGLAAAEVLAIYNADSAGKCAIPASNCVSPPSGLVSWWRAEGNFVDELGNDNGTNSGVAFGPGRIGQAFVGNGNGSVVQLGNPANLRLQDFTIETWIRRNNSSLVSLNGNGNGTIFGYDNGGYGLYLSPSGEPALTKTAVDNVTSGFIIADTNLHHLAVTKSGSSVVFYIDGVAHAVGPYDPGFTFSTTAYIGGLGNNYNFLGTIDEVSFYNRALAASEIQTIYGSTADKCGSSVAPSITAQPASQTVFVGEAVSFTVSVSGTPPLSYQWRFNGTNLNGATASSLTLTNLQIGNSGNYSVLVTNPVGPMVSSNALLTVNPLPPCTTPPSGLVSWWKGEGNFLDQIGANKGTNSGGVVFGPGRVGQAFVVNGNGSVVQLGNPASLRVQDFTIETWIRRNNTSLVSINGNGNGTIFGYDNGGYGLYLSPGGEPALTKTAVDNVTAGFSITDTNLHHLAVTKSGSSVIFYLDGVAHPVAPYNPGFTFSTAAYIGGLGNNFNFWGTIDEVSFYNRPLAASEIQAIYNANAGGKCTATSPNCSPMPSGLLSWWRGEGNALDQIGGNDGTLSGNVTFGTAEVGQGFFIDGTGPLVNITNTASLQVQDLSIELWIRRSSSTVVSRDGNGNGHIFGFGPGGYTLYMDPSGHPSFGKTGVSAVPCTAAITDTNLHHVAVTKTGSTVVFYIDGTSLPAAAYNPGFTFSGPVYIGGVAGDANFYGTVDEVSVYNRALAGAEVLAIYNADGSGKCTTGVPPTITSQPQSLTLNAGATANFTVTAAGTAPLSYQWTFTGTNIASATTTSLTVSNVQASSSGNYAVRVTNAFGVILSSNAVLVVNNNQTNCATPPAGLISWWKGDGNALDQFGGNHGTLSGNVTFGSAEVGQGFFIDGTGPLVNITNTTSLQVQDLSIELWVRRASSTVVSRNGNGNGHIFGFGPGGYTLYMDPSGHPSLGKTGVSAVSCTAAITDTNLHHVAVTKSGSTVVFYIDGTSLPAAAYNPGFTFSGPVYIGGVAGDANFYGTVDEVSVYNRGLAAAEVLAIYSADGSGKCLAPPPGNCVPPPSGLVAWWRAEGNGADQTGTNNATLVGNTTFAAGKVGQAFVFDGSGDALSLSNRTTLQLQNFTIEAWIKRSSTTQVSFDFNGGEIFSYGGGGYVFGLKDDGHPFLSRVEVSEVVSAQSITDLALHHVAVSKNGTNVVFYLDGVAYVAPPFTDTFTFATPPAIGARGDNFQNSFLGAIDEVSIYNRALSAGELQGIYGSGSFGKCVPPPATNCTPSPSGLVSWWKGEGNFLDELGNDNGTNSGVTFGAGRVGQAFIVNGNGSVVQLGNPANLRLQDFTIESWIRRNNTSVVSINGNGNGVIFGYGNGGYVLYLSPGGEPALSKSGIDNVGAGFSITDTNLHHLAVTKSGSSVVFYLDGVAHTVAPYNPGFTFSTAASIGGLGNNFTFWGAIDEVSFYNRPLAASEIQAIYNADGAGKCLTPAAPFIVTQPANQTVTVGNDATFSIVAGGSQPLTYQWRLNGTNISAATSSSFTITNAQPANAGPYSVLVTNIFGSLLSSNALLTVNPGPSLLRVGDASAASGATVTVPVLLTASGSENALQFSLNFSPSRLTYVSAILASGTGATLLLNESGTSTGRVGIVIGLPAGSTFPPGTQELVEVTFTTAILTNAATTSISFVDQPLARQISDQSGNVLTATYTSGTVSIAAAMFEADLSPRPNGDKAVTVTDWVLIGRFAAHLDSPTNASEFQRADCAPRATLGNGQISITDWVQAGRYAAGLDPLTPVGGPTGSAANAATIARKSLKPSSTRQLRAVDTTLNQGQTGNVSIKLQSQGNENALGFSVTFDPAALTYTGATLGSAAAGATLNMNTSDIASGRIGFALALSSGGHFAAGLDELVQVSFQAATSATGNVSVAFSDLPIEREISDPLANTLASDYLIGTIAIAPTPSLNILQVGQNIQLSWPNWATNFVLQETADVNTAGTWSNVTATVTTTATESGSTVPKSGGTKFYRLYKP